jgi:peptide/nickel transport system substrate-binding protein
MNNKLINKTYRQAISYAVNYDYILSDILDGEAVRMNSPVPQGISYHKADIKAPVLNLTIARQTLIDAGLSKGLTITSTDAEWENLADTNPILTTNYTWNTGNQVRADIGTLIKENLKKIGISMELCPLEWSAYLPILLGDFDRAQLYMIGWGADYNDPGNFINPLLSNTSSSNGAQVNDPYLQKAMMDALKETDPVARKQLYYDIQTYVVEDLMPWLMLYIPKTMDAMSSELRGWNLNVMTKVKFSTCDWKTVNSTVVISTLDCGGASGDAGAGGAGGSGSAAIDGFSIVTVLGVAAMTVGVILRKKKN